MHLGGMMYGIAMEKADVHCALFIEARGVVCGHSSIGGFWVPADVRQV
jgi:hypothetical protein